MKLFIETHPESGLTLRAPDPLATALAVHSAAQIETISYYNGDDDVLLEPIGQSLTSTVSPRAEPGVFEVTFRGTITVDGDAHRVVLEHQNDGAGFDYSLCLTTRDGQQWWAGEDWEFIENQNIMVRILK